MHKRLAWVMLCLAVPLGHAQQGPTGKGVEAPPSSGFLLLDDEDLRSPLTDLSIHLAKLKGERQALVEVRDQAAEQAQETTSPEAHDSAKLRLRLGELLTRMGSRKDSPRALPKQLLPPPVPQGNDPKTGPKPVTKEPPPKSDTPPVPEVGKPLDPLALAQALFRAGNYSGAMQAYKIIPQEGLKADERAPLQYMIATCLKKMGKDDEAATIYREVANSKGDEQLALGAQWQLSALRWHRIVYIKQFQ